MRQEEVCREQVGPDWAAPAGGMWIISIPLVSSIKRQELSKSPSVCVPNCTLCEHTCVFLCLRTVSRRFAEGRKTITTLLLATTAAYMGGK